MRLRRTKSLFALFTLLITFVVAGIGCSGPPTDPDGGVTPPPDRRVEPPKTALIIKSNPKARYIVAVEEHNDDTGVWGYKQVKKFIAGPDGTKVEVFPRRKHRLFRDVSWNTSHTAKTHVTPYDLIKTAVYFEVPEGKTVTHQAEWPTEVNPRINDLACKYDGRWIILEMEFNPKTKQFGTNALWLEFVPVKGMKLLLNDAEYKIDGTITKNIKDGTGEMSYHYKIKEDGSEGNIKSPCQIQEEVNAPLLLLINGD